VLNQQRTSIYAKRRKILFEDEGIVDEILLELIAQKPELEEVLSQKKEQYTKDAVYHIFRIMMLQIIDTLWMEHLDAMEHLRNSVNLRAYGQRDPLVEYKKEGLRMFRGLEATLRSELILFIENLDGFFAQQQARIQAENGFVSVIPSTEGNTSISSGVSNEKVGRNDPCPCGSGKKWKKCGELNTEEHKQLLAI
jgi:preprotein translocase subunit SecA